MEMKAFLRITWKKKVGTNNPARNESEHSRRAAGNPSFLFEPFHFPFIYGSFWEIFFSFKFQIIAVVSMMGLFFFSNYNCPFNYFVCSSGFQCYLRLFFFFWWNAILDFELWRSRSTNEIHCNLQNESFFDILFGVWWDCKEFQNVFF